MASLCCGCCEAPGALGASPLNHACSRVGRCPRDRLVQTQALMKRRRPLLNGVVVQSERLTVAVGSRGEKYLEVW